MDPPLSIHFRQRALAMKLRPCTLFIVSNGGQETPAIEDIAIFSTLYPDPGFFTNFGSITGTVFAPDGVTPVSGVNVISRNILNSIEDTVSAISGNFTTESAAGMPFVGVYTLNGLTPGANYALYIDEMLAGGFSTTPRSPLPGDEEFYNGASESSDESTDDPSVFTTVTAVAGSSQSGIDIIFNSPPCPPGDPLSICSDQANFVPQETISVTLRRDNPGFPVTVDFYAGVILPDGDTTISFTDPGSSFGSLSNPITLIPFDTGVDLSTPITIDDPGFFLYTWTGGEPTGTYLLYLAAVLTGAFDDGTNDPGDVLELSTSSFVFTP